MGGSLMGAYGNLRALGLVFCTTAATGDGLRLSPWDDDLANEPVLAFFGTLIPRMLAASEALATSQEIQFEYCGRLGIGSGTAPLVFT